MAGAKVSNEIDELRRERYRLRSEQRKKAEELHPAMVIFTKTLSETDPITALYFIEYVTIYLNQRNAIELKDINWKYS